MKSLKTKFPACPAVRRIKHEVIKKKLFYLHASILFCIKKHIFAGIITGTRFYKYF